MPPLTAPNEAQTANMLREAKAAMDAGNIAGCEQLCQQILAVIPDHWQALSLYGTSLGRNGRFESALEVFSRASSLAPQEPDIAYGLATTLVELKRFTEAEKAYLNLLEKASAHPEAYNNLGMLYLNSGRRPLAIACFREAIKIQPQFVMAQINLAGALQQADRTEEALAVIKASEVESLAPMMLIRAMALIDLKRREEASETLKPLVQKEPKNFEAHYVLANNERNLARSEEALRINQAALANGGPLQIFGFSIARIQLEQGLMEEAKSTLMKILEDNPLHSRSWLLLAQAHKFTSEDPLLAQMAEAVKKTPQQDLKRAEMQFAYAMALDKAGQFDQAFPFFLEANAQYFRKQGSDLNYTRAVHQSVRQRFHSPSAISATPQPTKVAARPIFIISMPRSGSTLVEQIIASHPKVSAGGELTNLFDATFRKLPAYPKGLIDLTPEMIAAIGQDYKDSLPRQLHEKECFTDKMPSNFERLGMVVSGIPEASIIHIMRNPIDTCLSCFMNRFASGQYFSYDLNALGQYYQLYRQMMDHWQDVLPAGSILTVNYEDLVGTPEEVVRKMLDHCGLEWSDSCLNFQTTQRRVATASYVQVRQPLYRTSLEKWRRYASHLGPLIEALGPYAPKDLDAIE